MQYMRENTFQSETEIATESLRYSVDIPAQALGYKLGALKMIDLREKAKQRIGPHFDIREFQEWVIGSGSMPSLRITLRATFRFRSESYAEYTTPMPPAPSQSSTR